MKEELENGSLVVPAVKNMLLLRRLPGTDGDINPAYLFFCRHFLKCVIGIHNFNRQVKQQVPLTQIASPSDEVLALLLLENSVETRWNREFEQSRAKLARGGVVKERVDDEEENSKQTYFETRYTTAGNNKKQKGFTKRNQGWSKEGILRYNVISEKVKEDRIKNGELFDQSFAEYMKGFNQSEESDDGNHNKTNWAQADNDLNELWGDKKEKMDSSDEEENDCDSIMQRVTQTYEA